LTYTIQLHMLVWNELLANQNQGTAKQSQWNPAKIQNDKWSKLSQSTSLRYNFIFHGNLYSWNPHWIWINHFISWLTIWMIVICLKPTQYTCLRPLSWTIWSSFQQCIDRLQLLNSLDIIKVYCLAKPKYKISENNA